MFNDIFNDKMMVDFQNKLKLNGETITVAESCTGGLISSMITKISGSSSIFRGSVITYCNDIKEQELNVKKHTMIQYGAVSKQTVKEMCEGVLRKFDSSYAIAISGVAGPTGGTIDKPVGTVVIGVMSKKGDENIQIYKFDGNREEVQIQAAKTALKINFEILFKNY
ncbi:MAG: CinA family protein [Campylobacterota bacterium]|nr:CinA family protein [Campylobacterota bacterium]